MNWETPKDEEEWLERLSALMDGELEADEARWLRRQLEQDPAHAALLAALEASGSRLRGWGITAPHPPGKLLDAARRADARRARREGRPAGGRAWRWAAQAVVFVAGAALGGVAGLPWRPPASAPTVVERVVVVTVVATPTPVSATAALSARQVDAMLRENEAAAMAGKARALLGRGQMSEARAVWDEMGARYSDTRKYRELQREYDRKPGQWAWVLAGRL